MRIWQKIKSHFSVSFYAHDHQITALEIYLQIVGDYNHDFAYTKLYCCNAGRSGKP